MTSGQGAERLPAHWSFFAAAAALPRKSSRVPPAPAALALAEGSVRAALRSLPSSCGFASTARWPAKALLATGGLLAYPSEESRSGICNGLGIIARPRQPPSGGFCTGSPFGTDHIMRPGWTARPGVRRRCRGRRARLRTAPAMTLVVALGEPSARSDALALVPAGSDLFEYFTVTNGMVRSALSNLSSIDCS
jgi:hypothetical protein